MMKWVTGFMLLLTIPAVVLAEERTKTNCRLDGYGGFHCTSNTERVPRTAMQALLDGLNQRQVEASAPQIIYVPVQPVTTSVQQIASSEEIFASVAHICHVDGQRFPKTYKYCPIHGKPLYLASPPYSKVD